MKNTNGRLQGDYTYLNTIVLYSYIVITHKLQKLLLIIYTLFHPVVVILLKILYIALVPTISPSSFTSLNSFTYCSSLLISC